LASSPGKLVRLRIALLPVVLAGCGSWVSSAAIDQDGDGHEVGLDCDDDRREVHPGAIEYCDGLDNDCDGDVDDDAVDSSTWFPDSDGDGYGNAAYEEISCEQYEGYVSDDADCADHDPSINPGAIETWYDGVDQDCDGASDYDQDGDGYRSDEHGGTDCDDADPVVHPDAEEFWYDGVDQDCDGASDYDQDADGYESDEHGGADCRDTDPDIHPNAEEVCGDDLDNDCDGEIDVAKWFLDADGDSYGDASSTESVCEQPSGYVGDSTDCDDGDAQIFPGQIEECDGRDNDCSGVADEGDPCPCPITWRDDLLPYMQCWEPLTFNAAEKICGSDYHLIVFDSEEELSWFYKDTGTTGRWWIGYTDRKTEGDWSWVNGSSSIIEDWCDNEPDDYDGEDHAYTYYGECWIDYDGDKYERMFFCEPFATDP